MEQAYDADLASGRHVSKEGVIPAIREEVAALYRSCVDAYDCPAKDKTLSEG